MINLLLENDCDVQMLCESGHYAMKHLIDHNRVEIIQRLIDNHEFEFDNYSETYGPIYQCIINERPDCLDIILQAGADPNQVSTEEEAMPPISELLGSCCSPANKLRMLIALCSSGADPTV